jgi:hypothetical protein
MMREVIYENGCFFDESSEYVKDTKYEALCASTQRPFSSLLTEAQC